MSCQCENKEKCTCQSGCKGAMRNAWKCDLDNLYRQEPWCGNGGCVPRHGGPERDAVRLQAALGGLVQAGAVQYELGPEGAYLIFPNGYRAKVASLCAAESEYGPHFNRERRVSDFSPRDIESVAAAFGWTSEALPINSAVVQGGYSNVPGTTGWFLGWLAALGVSHIFCLEEITIRVTFHFQHATEPALDITVPATVTAVAVGGICVVCGDGEEDADEGSYVRALAAPEQADPEAIDITPERCACDELCAYTPARGAEVFYFKYDTPATPVPPAGYTLITQNPFAVSVSVKVRRCAWLSLDEAFLCVNAMGNLIPSNPTGLPNTAGGVTTAIRATGGDIPFLGG